MDSLENYLFLGSSTGVIRIVDIQDVKNLKIIKHLKLYKGKEISQIRFNYQQNQFAVSSI